MFEVRIKGWDEDIHAVLDSQVPHDMLSDCGQTLVHLMSHDVLAHMEQEAGPASFKQELKIGDLKITVKS